MNQSLHRIGLTARPIHTPPQQNLRNVAVPGTGVALSYFCWFKPLAYLFILGLYPLLALIGAFNVARHEFKASRGLWAAYGALCAAYREHLLAPEDWCAPPSPLFVKCARPPMHAPSHWSLHTQTTTPSRFTYWRLNSRIAAYHELLTHSPGYKQEDKWTFLVDGDRLGVPVTPVIKVRSMEKSGGLACLFMASR